MALTKITSDVIGTGAVTSDHLASGAVTHSSLSSITTDNVSEGSTNTYFTNARARSSVSVTGGGLSYDSGTGVIQIGSIPNASLTNSSLTVNSNSVSLGGSVTLDTDDIGEGSTNLYFTNARAQGAISGGTGVTVSSGTISIGQDVATSSTPTFGNITTTGYIAGPATFTIDPAAVGDNTGTVVIAGDLRVDGTTTTINSTTLTVDDKNILLGQGAALASDNNGAGITVDTANASILWDETNTEWDFNNSINVTGAVTADNAVFGTTSDSQTIVYITSSTTGESELRLGDTDTDAGSISYTNSNDTLTFRAAAANRMTLNSSGLDVTGTVTADGLTINGVESPMIELTDLSTSNELQIYADNSGGVIRTSTDDDLFLRTNSLNRIKLDNGGDISFYDDTGSSQALFWDASEERLGIGTTNPQFALDVTGLIRATSDVYLQGDVYVDSKIRHNGDVDNYITFSAADTQGFITGNSTRLQITNSLVRFNQENTNQDFSVYSLNSDNMLYVDASTDRVGIGTSSPDEDLHVSGTGDKVIAVESTSTGTGANAGLKILAADGGDFLWQTGNVTGNALRLYDLNASAERLRIDSSGNVGIGETDPETSLHIKNSGNSFLTLERSGTTGGTGKFGINMEGGSSQQTTMAYDDGGKLVIGRSSDPATHAGFSNDFILKGGFVGIKTLDPQVELHVTGNANISGSTTSGGVITANHIIRSDAGHNTARVEAVYDDGEAYYDSNILMWVSEPGYTYDSGGIGVNINESGHYYGRKYDNDYAVFMRFQKSDGAIQFGQNQGTAGTAGASQTETLKITANGTLRLATTGGIGFGSINAADTLDDYEEGNFTPTFVASGGTAPSSQTGTGQYTKIGDVVHLTGQIVWNGAGSGGSNLYISIPFNVISDARGGIAIGLNSGVNYAQDHTLHLVPEINTNVIYLISTHYSVSGHTHLSYSNISNAGSKIFSFSGSFHTRD